MVMRQVRRPLLGTGGCSLGGGWMQVKPVKLVKCIVFEAYQIVLWALLNAFAREKGNTSKHCIG